MKYRRSASCCLGLILLLFGFSRLANAGEACGGETCNGNNTCDPNNCVVTLSHSGNLVMIQVQTTNGIQPVSGYFCVAKGKSMKWQTKEDSAIVKFASSPFIGGKTTLSATATSAVKVKSGNPGCYPFSAVVCKAAADTTAHIECGNVDPRVVIKP